MFFIPIVTEPQCSLLHPPKPPPSVWQIYFTDWLHRLRYYSKPEKKLNVAQEAKEAAIAYSELSEDDKEACLKSFRHPVIFADCASPPEFKSSG